MVDVNDFMKVDIEYDDLVQAISLSLDKSFLDNLRQRNAFVQLDSKVRGYLGEFAIRKLINTSKHLSILEADYVPNDSYEDKDIVVENKHSSDIILEIKTSLMPDIWHSLDAILKNADIKIIKREQSYKNIRADFHVQVYFNFYRKERDKFLSELPGVPDNYTIEKLIEIMRLEKLRELFVAWIDKPTLIKNLDGMACKTWHFGYRDFWKCPLRLANPPSEFINVLESYKK